MAAGMASKTMLSMEKDVKDDLEKFNTVQKDLQKCQSSRDKLEWQLTENENVQKEMILLEADAVIYKLIGPVLVKQDVEEAKLTVDKRISYITEEIKRYEAKVKDLQKEHDSLAEKLMKMQQSYQQQMTKAGMVPPQR